MRAQGYSLAQIAEYLGVECPQKGDTAINGLASFDRAGPGELTFCTAKITRDRLKASAASAVLVPPELAGYVSGAYLPCPKPRLAFARVTQLYATLPRIVPGIHETAIVSDAAELGVGVAIGPHAVIEEGAQVGDNVQIGAGCTVGRGSAIGEGGYLYPRVSLYHDVTIGRNAIVHSGSVIGADGFGFESGSSGQEKFCQLGGVRIEDDFECGALCTIDRGALEDTFIASGVKMDDQVHIGHNVHIGAHSLLSGKVGVGGGARIGSWCAIGGGTIILSQIVIADRVFIEASSLVSRSIRVDGTRASSGWAAQEYKFWHKLQMAMTKEFGKRFTNKKTC
ncbi:MAG: UDP-3-O-(3-hydroxymyristoyl)glucosamine N-acyltransferase [Gammaproteobacteria bacterium]